VETAFYIIAAMIAGGVLTFVGLMIWLALNWSQR
jgi:hypothetical protein